MSDQNPPHHSILFWVKLDSLYELNPTGLLTASPAALPLGYLQQQHRLFAASWWLHIGPHLRDTVLLVSSPSNSFSQTSMAHYVTSLCCLLELPSPITCCPIPHHLLYPPCALHSTRHHLIQYLSVWLTICLFPLERKRHDNKGFVFLRLCPQCKQVSGIYKALSKRLLNGHLSPCNSLILSQP